jgi:signal-transduction protein with cAMP-binding, CBS, and nucleotidyltransferase domain
MISAEELLRSKQRELISIGPDATIAEALQVMTQNNVGSILIKDGNDILGIWTERDLLYNTVADGFDCASSRISDFMIRDLVFTPHTDTVYNLMDKILGRRHRRLLIEKDGEFIGLLTAGDVMKAFMQEKNRELLGLNQMVGWEYYEDWCWAKESGRAERRRV